MNINTLFKKWKKACKNLGEATPPHKPKGGINMQVAVLLALIVMILIA